MECIASAMNDVPDLLSRTCIDWSILKDHKIALVSPASDNPSPGIFEEGHRSPYRTTNSKEVIQQVSMNTNYL